MIIRVDIDGTICTQSKDGNYANAKPIAKNITKINKLYDNNIIIYWTARGTTTGKDWRDLTIKQLKEWGCKYHRLELKKPYYDLLICDKSHRIEENMGKLIIIAEIGINHNGSVDTAKQLIDGAIFAGADAVKFQKRTIDTVYTKEQLDSPRNSPFGTTFRQQKEGLEFSEKQYDEIDEYCKMRGIQWFASAWDIDSQLFLRKYNLMYNKVASAMLTYHPLLEKIAEEKKHTFISTGMSTMEEIGGAVVIFNDADCPYELMHTTSTYPMKSEDANLSMIKQLREWYDCDVGYSSHSTGIIIPCAAVALGATSIECHLTLDRSSYGSDHSSSMEVEGFRKMAVYARTISKAIGDAKKQVLPEENVVAGKLRWFM